MEGAEPGDSAPSSRQDEFRAARSGAGPPGLPVS